mmetsp:Transcript_9583/g.13389  ORF Transcript_9583/g.13389 Transcript_9583/m.13389 type:complete len:107 (+) Transcript_9583:46-366(+)|eukprot:CAMPEP_0184487684 /NCGR_PEP_ID=MMETSP0113_2-20130426/10266_1 /TAXON_ID=91329 /ORGANISM="Norrisiella sphaerica, Strain BC52" /LENGTH=106 /DNA_ID=CAMNT_0026870061 /DNA_START=46 /DNA_END=366 /DNA_ORIENTATION=+
MDALMRMILFLAAMAMPALGSWSDSIKDAAQASVNDVRFVSDRFGLTSPNSVDFSSMDMNMLHHEDELFEEFTPKDYVFVQEGDLMDGSDSLFNVAESVLSQSISF